MWRLTLVLGFLALFVSAVGGWPIPGMLASLVLFCTAVAVLLRAALVQVPAERLAVVVDRDRDAAVRLLPPGVHRVRPFLEIVEGHLHLEPTTTNVQAQLYSDGGVLLMAYGEATYQLEPGRLPPAEQPRLARRLARRGEQLVTREVGSALQAVMSTLTIGELFAGGGRGRLERLARHEAAERLAAQGVALMRVRLHTINLPPDVADALAAAHERALHAESQARALARLHGVIAAFSDEDMARLTELERLRLLDRNGAIPSWPLPVIIDGAATATGPAPRASGRAARRRAAMVPASP